MRRRAWLLVSLGSLLVAGGFAVAAMIPVASLRAAVPDALVETARVAGYGDIRFWGDEITPPFNRAITTLYEQIKAGAASGVEPQMLDHAEFLAISGGGDNGAFTAGLIKGWTDSGTRPTFETVTGVSTGALAAPFVFLGPDYDEALRDIYTKHSSNDLYTDNGLFGILGVSLKNTAPLEALIRGYATDAFLDRLGAQYHLGRRLLAATTDLDAQRPVIWDLTGIAASGRPDRRDLFVKVLLASAAIPGVFPPVRIPVVADDGRTYEELHVDGGVTSEVTFVPPEVQLADYEKKVFGHLRDRTLYVIRNGKLVPEYEASKESALDLAARGVATLVKYQVLSNLRILAQGADDGKTHFFFDAIPQGFGAVATSNFDLNYARLLFACGIQVGKAGTWLSVPGLTPIQERDMTPSKGDPNATTTNACL